jgi:hypothetical protein
VEIIFYISCNKIIHNNTTFQSFNFKIYIDIYKTVFNLFSVNAIISHSYFDVMSMLINSAFIVNLERNQTSINNHLNFLYC